MAWQSRSRVPVLGWGGHDDCLDLSLGNAWVRALVIILQGLCCFTVLVHYYFVALLLPSLDPSRKVGLQRSLSNRPHGDSMGQVFGEAGLIALSSYQCPGYGSPHLLPLVTSHAHLPGHLCPHSLPLFSMTSAFRKPSPALVSKWS